MFFDSEDGEEGTILPKKAPVKVKLNPWPMPNLLPLSKRLRIPKRVRQTPNQITSPIVARIRKTAIIDSKANEYWTLPANLPQTDPVKTVRNATTDGISKASLEPHLMPKETNVADVEDPEELDEVDLDAEALEAEVVVANVISTASPEMTKLESRPSIRRMEADLITGELSRTKLKPKMTRPTFLPKI